MTILRTISFATDYKVNKCQDVLATISVFILDDKGIIRYIWVSEEPGVEPNYIEIEENLRHLT